MYHYEKMTFFVELINLFSPYSFLEISDCKQKFEIYLLIQSNEYNGETNSSKNI